MASTRHHHALQEGPQGPREFEAPPVEGPPHGRTAERIIIQPVARWQHKPPAQREGMAGPAAAAPATGDTTCIWPSSDLTFHSSAGPACMILMIAAHHVLGMDVPISEPVTSSCMPSDRCVENQRYSFLSWTAWCLLIHDDASLERSHLSAGPPVGGQASDQPLVGWKRCDHFSSSSSSWPEHCSWQACV